MDADLLKKIFDTIEGYRDPIITLQTELTALPALGPTNEGEGEAAKAEYLKGWMEKEIGFDSIEDYNVPDERVPGGYRPNIVAIMKGKSDKRRIWVMGHLDIVPPGDLNLWDSDPYKVTEKDGKLYGRGVEDNQHGIVTPLFAVKALKELGVAPAYDVGIVLVADEETGSEYGIQHLLKEHDIFKKEDFILVPDSGSPDGSMIEVAEKSILWLKFETKGKQCHASTPAEGINAHRAAAHLITRLGRLYETFDQRNEVFEPPISTFEPTKKEANVPNINTIPGDDVFYLDSRILPEIPVNDVCDEIASIAGEVEKEFGVTITTSSPQREDAAPATPSDAPVVEALSASIKGVYNVESKAIGIGGGTVAAFFRRAGFHAVVWSRIDELAHQPNEYTVIDNMVGDTKVFAHLFMQE
ncbi:MAG: M20 family metallo-hydrolase [bacterium]|nr:MAG: M20 family metallo-hydrolase [bacterium]